MNILIGADHRGFDLKNGIMQSLKTTADSQNVNWIDIGCFSRKCCDYPVAAYDLVCALQKKQADLGVLLCGTGVGMAIAANRFSGIYAALVWTPELARLAREHDNANILVLPSDYLTIDQSVNLIQAWLGASFEGGRHLRRIEQIDSFGGIKI